MVREKVTVSTRTLQWKCVESKADNKRLYYGRFILSPLIKGQADTIGIAMRRALLGEIEGTCITRAKSDKIPHEYSTLVGIQESVHDILMNLKEIVLRSNLYGTCDASICVRGPGYVTAQDIILPPYVEVVDNTQHIASLTEPIELHIGLQIERSRGYLIKTPNNNFQGGSYPIDAVFMPVRNANHSIHSYGNGNDKQEILFLEIWTNGSLTPKEALHEASRNLIDLFIPFLHTEEENLHLADNQHMVPLPPFTFHDNLDKLRKNTKKIALKSIFIDQSELPPRIYNYLKRSNIYTLLDLLNNSQEELMKIEHFRINDVKQILGILEKHFSIDLPKKSKMGFESLAQLIDSESG
uniref:DNA-directed RNA polymerase subunit alpha n=2 Tax=Selineae TaxID=241792 RepID=A0A1B1MTH0_9APIA|nr:RpoA [Ledebouriella seseloides]YP_009918352.1 RNA polymerase alpha subunit [Saposhnikovia divaricata]ANS72145.1 RpoA [Ledebouriella seseloides]AOT84413.1 RpoA [Ledebouriella seseloides]QGU85572.1 RpoA [Saposhnikovia divaricata]QLX47564.1 RNA polymerase alpha subunit [Saposhnikovia divaricata]QWQ51922.1 RNA polymerase alpha subunit [Saposhnikovia divaricata]